MKVDCLDCANLKTDIAWGPHTEAPPGYCQIMNIYIWKTDRKCPHHDPLQTSDEIQDPNQKVIK